MKGVLFYFPNDSHQGQVQLAYMMKWSPHNARYFRLRLVVVWLLSCGILFQYNRSLRRLTFDTSVKKPPPVPTPCIAFLLANAAKDVHNSILAIESIDDYIKDESAIPLLVFQEGDLSSETRKLIISASQNREIIFPYVDFSSYPSGFDPLGETNNINGTWGHQQVSRFWINQLWTHDAVRDRNCESIMRLDADSCFLKHMDVGDALPGLKWDTVVYRANKMQKDNSAPFVKGLFQFTQLYMETKSLKPRNKDMWEKANTLFQKTGRLPSFSTDFEICKVSFFARKDVMDYQMAIADQQPFGVFRESWSDVHVRFITLALFAEPSMVDLNTPSSYGHGWRCPGIHGDIVEGF